MLRGDNDLTLSLYQLKGGCKFQDVVPLRRFLLLASVGMRLRLGSQYQGLRIFFRSRFLKNHKAA